MSRAAFLDRDGVINEKPPEGQYVTRWEEMRFLPGVAPAIALLNRAGFQVLVVSNQRCIAKGLITTADLESMHQRMCCELAVAGATIDGVYYCPHEAQPPCSCRKPAPGMLLDAARAHQIDLTASWMIGDSDIDVEAGRNAGCKTARLLIRDETAVGNSDVVAPSLLEAIHQILKWEESQAEGMGPRPHDDREADGCDSPKSVKTMDNGRHGAAYARIVGAFCASILCIILIAGLWPFHAPKNEVSWLRNDNGLQFGRYGSVVSSGAFHADSSKDDTPVSLEIWLEPSKIDDISTILAFDSSGTPSMPFALKQYAGGLLVQRQIVDQQGNARNSTFKVGRVFRKGVPSFVSITSGPENTSVYVDGVMTERSPSFRVSSKDFTGRLVVANSVTLNDSWSGQLLGLAIYHRQLTPTQVAKHYESWKTSQRPALAQDEAPAALYFCDEGKGNMVRNQVDTTTDLVIPSQYFVLHPRFLSAPWREYYAGWHYWKDISINIGGFIPLGFSLVAYFSSVREHSQPAATAIVLGFVISLSIETLQTLLPTRNSGMTDILTNTLGTAIGVLAYRCPVVQAVLTKARRYAVSFLEDHSGKEATGSLEVGSRVSSR